MYVLILPTILKDDYATYTVRKTKTKKCTKTATTTTKKQYTQQFLPVPIAL